MYLLKHCNKIKIEREKYHLIIHTTVLIADLYTYLNVINNYILYAYRKEDYLQITPPASIHVKISENINGFKVLKHQFNFLYNPFDKKVTQLTIKTLKNALLVENISFTFTHNL